MMLCYDKPQVSFPYLLILLSDFYLFHVAIIFKIAASAKMKTPPLLLPALLTE